MQAHIYVLTVFRACQVAGQIRSPAADGPYKGEPAARGRQPSFDITHTLN